MNFQLPQESTIVNGLCRLDCTIFNFKDVVSFLSENIANKKTTDRFISWLVMLKIISQKKQSWGTELYLMARNYFYKCKECFSKISSNPLSFHPNNIQALIKPDIESGIKWFETILKSADLTEFINSPTLRLNRIYSMISIENDNSLYCPNSFYIGCICLAMTSIFSQDAGLSADFAESIAFYLAKTIHSIIPLLHIESNEVINEHFFEIDELIKIKAPEQSKSIKQNKSSAIYFGMRYEQFLFSWENHTLEDIFNIWDQIFSHFTKNEFISCLTVAHICQIQIPPGPQNVNDIISNWKNWDTIKIIKDALEMLEHKRSFTEKCCFYFCPNFDLSGYDASYLRL